MPLLLHKPAPQTILAFLDRQASLPFTYTGVGASATTPPPGYVVDHTRIQLGEGEATFLAARAALQRWQHFHLGWVEAHPKENTIHPGAVVAVLARIMRCWWLNACRIVYVVDEHGPVERSGFAYGTLPGHAETGEERFVIEWDRATGAVYYDILAFSRPRHTCARLAYPLTRQFQRRFARDSAQAMLNATQQK